MLTDQPRVVVTGMGTVSSLGNDVASMGASIDAGCAVWRERKPESRT